MVSNYLLRAKEWCKKYFHFLELIQIKEIKFPLRYRWLRSGLSSTTSVFSNLFSILDMLFFSDIPISFVHTIIGHLFYLPAKIHRGRECAIIMTCKGKFWDFATVGVHLLDTPLPPPSFAYGSYILHSIPSATHKWFNFGMEKTEAESV